MLFDTDYTYCPRCLEPLPPPSRSYENGDADGNRGEWTTIVECDNCEWNPFFGDTFPRCDDCGELIEKCICDDEDGDNE